MERTLERLAGRGDDATLLRLCTSNKPESVQARVERIGWPGGGRRGPWEGGCHDHARHPPEPGLHGRPRPRLPLVVGPGRARPARRRRRRGLLVLGRGRQPLPRLLVASSSTSTSATSTPSWSPPSRSRPASCARSPRSTPTTRAARRPGSSPSSPRATSNMVFFTNGGAEATENAIRMARLHTGRHKVLTDLPQLPRRAPPARSR